MTNADPPPPPNAVASENPAELLALVYNELRRLAAAKLARESGALTLQPTALVHEAWLRLGGDAQPAWANRRHFFAAAAESMRRILIDSARRKHAARRGAGAEKVSANATGFDLAAPSTDDELLLVNDALDALATHDARKAELVKLKYFGGLTLEEAADTLGISHRTAPRSATGPTPAPGSSTKSPASATERFFAHGTHGIPGNSRDLILCRANAVEKPRNTPNTRKNDGARRPHPPFRVFSVFRGPLLRSFRVFRVFRGQSRRRLSCPFVCFVGNPLFVPFAEKPRMRA